MPEASCAVVIPIKVTRARLRRSECQSQNQDAIVPDSTAKTTLGGSGRGVWREEEEVDWEGGRASSIGSWFEVKSKDNRLLKGHVFATPGQAPCVPGNALQGR
jgi:hypothetical protein